MKVAIPIKEKNISKYFGQCSYYEIFSINNGKITQKLTKIPTVSKMQEIPLWIKEQNIDTIITYLMREDLLNAFIQNKINVFVGVPRKTGDELIQEFLDGNLHSNSNILIEEH